MLRIIVEYAVEFRADLWIVERDRVSNDVDRRLLVLVVAGGRRR